jgi:hypothetical protein
MIQFAKESSVASHLMIIVYPLHNNSSESDAKNFLSLELWIGLTEFQFRKSVLEHVGITGHGIVHGK